MLLLTMNIDKERYAIDARQVIEVIPLVRLDHVPRVDTCIAGIFIYRGETVPVIDLCQFFRNHKCQSRLGSRIILITLDNINLHKTIGLLAEQVTETIKCNEKDLRDSGIKDINAEFLGKILHYNNDIVQLINTDKIVPHSIAKQLMSMPIQ